MSNRPVNKFEAMSYLVNVLGDPALPLNDQPNQKAIQTVYGLYSGEGRGSKLQSANGTAWGLVNGITEYVDIHRRARNQDYPRTIALNNATPYRHEQSLNAPPFNRC